MKSPFNWQGTPSSFGKDKAFNGVNQKKSDTASSNSSKAPQMVLENTPVHCAPRGTHLHGSMVSAIPWLKRK
jgi:hypothetical protein